MIRAGILGCGDFAHRHVLILDQLKEEVELVAFADRNEWKARAFAEKYARGAVYTHHHTMFAQAKLDMVVICLPPYGHTDEVERAAEHGLHFLIEKPIALTSDKAWQMVEAAEKAGVKTQVGFMLRFGEAVERLKTLLDSGAVGGVGLMSARYFCNALHASWWRVREKSGGQVLEQAIHLFDLMRYLMGEPAAVYSRQENLFHRDTPDYTIEDVSASVVSFKSGGLGVVYATNNAIPGKWIHDYRVVAQKLTADFTSVNEATFYHTGSPDQPPEKITSTRDFRLAQMQDLLQAIRSGGTTRTPIREGAKSLDLVLAAVRSNEIRGEVPL
ncbi:MAG: Gfo/Idh/MocA family oxidoreductase [Anaerolineae bacterium]|nr:Gfo/Idh/MocA family oxidoreductase [Anaerolineae bacterium]